MTKQPLHLSVLNRGSIQFPRYLIGNDHRWFWTGFDWTDTESNAQLFTDWNEVASEVQKLLLQNRIAEPSSIRSFVAPIKLRLVGGDHCSVADLSAWAFSAARLLMDHPADSVGPGSNSLVISSIEWDQLSEVRQ
ncbi:hypothetical protein [Fuerstiella marisgermanici]|uniref:Uncharacterized protein n=1 Tax=Fuerstiella marisgermanici TaxID=1891926 RepID=A0A1P8WH04_9PLAN|nr:hypothetical protein [Fuerstiella marisgermanici]APZ93361.1 hypothetical protein Fuma_02978 [Fuerstiella marisgermanici]